MTSPFQALPPGSGPVRAATYLPASTDAVLWGRLPRRTDAPAPSVEPGTAVTVDTIGHERILEDQGRDPAASACPRTSGVDTDPVLGSYGLPECLDLVEQALADAVRDAAGGRPHELPMGRDRAWRLVSEEQR